MIIQGKKNDRKSKVRSGRVIYGKEGFRFYILNGLKKPKKFWNGNLSVNKGGGKEGILADTLY